MLLTIKNVVFGILTYAAFSGILIIEEQIATYQFSTIRANHLKEWDCKAKYLSPEIWDMADWLPK